MKFDVENYRYPSRRSVVFAKHGMVCTSAPLPAQAGLDVLRRGGNAIDAAVATAAALTVMEPVSNGIGGDAFALIWTGGKLYGLNASGYSPKAISAELLRSRGLTAVPKRGWEATMVPGVPGGWAALTQRFGSMPLSQLVEPAARYAEEGYPLSPNLDRPWDRMYKEFSKLEGPQFKPWLDEFAPDDRAPRAGEIFRNQNLANTLREIGATNAESFYRGALMEQIVAFSQKTGGYFAREDFTAYQPRWVDPISVNYHGYDVFEIPPNGHGITVLMALNILNKMELGPCREHPDTYHRMIEALKLAFIDAKTYVADPRSMKTKVSDMLSQQYADLRRSLIRDDEALLPTAGDPACGGTVYLCTADDQGNMVSYIQSNYAGFGSGIVIPGTAIALQNRGANFSLDPASDNCLEGGKQAYHTIIPGFLMKDGKPVGPFGVMGGFMQPQGHLQVLINAIDFGMNPQECLDAPRFQWVGDKKIQLEPSVPQEIVDALRAKGHDIEILPERDPFGRGEIIWRMDNDVLAGACEPRCDGTVACW